jgi:polysaccharide biosynthesis/export protein
MKNNNPAFMKRLCLLFALALALSAQPLCLGAADALSNKTLQNDLSYYRKTAKAQNLGANDRYYILSRIEEKYKVTKVNLAPLRAELDKVKPGETAPQPDGAAAGKPAAPQAAAQSGTVKTVLVEETKTESRVTITADKVQRSNYFLLRDPDPAIPPKVVLDLYGVDDKLPEKDKEIKLKNGVFSQVRAAQFQKDPEKIVRIVADLREEKPYKIKNEGDKWLIISEKSEPAEALAAAAVPAAAPATPAPAVKVEISTPAAKPAASNDYLIDSGDVLSITVYPADELSREAIVQMDGSISMPLIGNVEAKGTTPKKLEDKLEDSFRKFITKPQVSISMRQFSRRQVFITGEVRSVGAYPYKDNLHLMEFISQTGGFTESANRREVKVYRGPATKRQISTLDVETLVKTGDFTKDFLLEPGDIIEVPKGAAKVAILGDVRSPGYYDFREKLHLLEFVSLAGGFTESANITKVSIIRDAGGKDKKTEKVDMNKILTGKDKDVEIRSGDTVYIPKKNMAAASGFVNNVLPWLSLIALIIVIKGGI